MLSVKTFQMQYTTLTNLVKAKAEIIWSTRCQAAFEAVKALLCSFKLKVDGSQTGFVELCFSKKIMKALSVL